MASALAGVVLATVMVAGGALLELVNSEGGLISFVLAGVLASFTVGRYVGGAAALWGPVLAVGRCVVGVLRGDRRRPVGL